MTTLLDQVVRRLMMTPNFQKLLLLGMIFSKVGAQPALSFMYMNHYAPPELQKCTLREFAATTLWVREAARIAPTVMARTSDPRTCPLSERRR